MATVNSKIFASLNSEQLAVAQHASGPAIVVAGPGSGKTHTLVRRVVGLVQGGIPGARILTATFSKKAAEELGARFQTVAAEAGLWEAPKATTMHSYGFSICRRAGLVKGRDSVLISNKMLIIGAKKSLRSKAAEKIEEDEARGYISRCKNALIDPARATKNAVGSNEKMLADIYAAYEKIKESEGKIDFDDMLYRAAQILGRGGRILDEERKAYDWVHVDEAQDNNLAQNRIIELVCGDITKANLMFIGDDCQAIYEWRGAAPKEFTRFAEFAKTYRLVKNYRSSQSIVDVGNKLAGSIVGRIEKTMVTSRKAEKAPIVFTSINAEDEAAAVVEHIKTALTKKAEPKDFCVIYRSNAQSLPLESALRKATIPFIIFGGRGFWSRAEVQEVVAYLKLAQGNDPEAIETIYNKPARYLGKAWLAEFQGKNKGDICKALNSYYSKSYMDRGAEALAEDILALREAAERSPLEVVDAILAIRGTVHPDKTLREFYAKAEGEEISVESEKLENLEALREMAQQHGTFGEFMLAIRKAADESKNDDKDAQLSSNTVKLMSGHRSKGLEFPTVFVVGCSEGLLPHFNGLKAGTINEERRLAFVAMTRPKDQLVISHLASRNGRFMAPSRFIAEAGLKIMVDSE